METKNTNPWKALTAEQKAKAVDRLLFSIAYDYKKYPSNDPKEDEYWQSILDKPENMCRKIGVCDVCGTPYTIIEEYGLNWVCEQQDCLDKIKAFYKKEIARFKKSKSYTGTLNYEN